MSLNRNISLFEAPKRVASDRFGGGSAALSSASIGDGGNQALAAAGDTSMANGPQRSLSGAEGVVPKAAAHLAPSGSDASGEQGKPG